MADVKNFPPYLDLPKREKPRTKYYKIRSMSIEELARFIHDQIIDRNIGLSVNDWLDWLRQEVEEK